LTCTRYTAQNFTPLVGLLTQIVLVTQSVVLVDIVIRVIGGAVVVGGGGTGGQVAGGRVNWLIGGANAAEAFALRLSLVVGYLLLVLLSLLLRYLLAHILTEI